MVLSSLKTLKTFEERPWTKGSELISVFLVSFCDSPVFVRASRTSGQKKQGRVRGIATATGLAINVGGEHLQKTSQ